jgi:hypothetical protein
MATFKKIIASAKAKVADAETKAFMARLEAIDAILQDALPHDVMMLCAHALAAVAPDCCGEHQDEFRTELLQMLRECIEMQEQDLAEADGDSGEGGDAPRHVH